MQIVIKHQKNHYLCLNRGSKTHKKKRNQNNNQGKSYLLILNPHKIHLQAINHS